MGNKELKKIMTDLAAGHISKKEAELLIKPKKARQKQPNKAKSTNTRKRSIK